MTDWWFDGRLVLRDGGGDVDLVIDIDAERISLRQGDRKLGEFPRFEVDFRWMEKDRIWLSFAGEIADFYPARSEEFVAALRKTRPSRRG